MFTGSNEIVEDLGERERERWRMSHHQGEEGIRDYTAKAHTHIALSLNNGISSRKPATWLRKACPIDSKRSVLVISKS